MSEVCERRESRDTREYGDVSIGIYFCENMQYIVIVDADWVVPIVWTESIFNIDDIGVSRKIIVDNSPSSIDNPELTICNIDPCLGSSRIGHITRDKEDIITTTIGFSIGHHRIVIGEYHHSWSDLNIGIDECWSDDTVLDDMDQPESFFLYCYLCYIELFIVLPLQS